MTERLVAAAIQRNGVVESRDFREHWRIRAALGDQEPSQKREGDIEGFLTSDGRFVGRYEASDIGYRSGQVDHAGIQLLSSMVNWEAKRAPKPGEKSDSLKRMLSK